MHDLNDLQRREKMRDMINDTNRDLTIVAVVLRVWNDTTYEQQLAWPKGKTIRQILEDFHPKRYDLSHRFPERV